MGGIDRLAVWSMDDEQLERLARVAADALAMTRAFRACGDETSIIAKEAIGPAPGGLRAHFVGEVGPFAPR